jgi:hypothetical protein
MENSDGIRKPVSQVVPASEMGFEEARKETKPEEQMAYDGKIEKLFRSEIDADKIPEVLSGICEVGAKYWEMKANQPSDMDTDFVARNRRNIENDFYLAGQHFQGKADHPKEVAKMIGRIVDEARRLIREESNEFQTRNVRIDYSRGLESHQTASKNEMESLLIQDKKDRDIKTDRVKRFTGIIIDKYPQTKEYFESMSNS